MLEDILRNSNEYILLRIVDYLTPYFTHFWISFNSCEPYWGEDMMGHKYRKFVKDNA